MADEFADKLNAVLGNPEAMGQIMSLARSLTGDSGDEGGSQPPIQPPVESMPAPASPASAAPSTQRPDLSGIMNRLGGLTGGGGHQGGGPTSNPLAALGDLDPRVLQAGMRLLSELGSTDDRKTALLTALRPFVKEERFAKVDRAIQVAKLSRVIRVAFQLFKEGGGQEHVEPIYPKRHSLYPCSGGGRASVPPSRSGKQSRTVPGAPPSGGNAAAPRGGGAPP